METYTFLRELADSWVLLAMVIFYIIACLWSFRPGAQSANDEAAGIPFRNDGDAPAQSQELEAE
ncbi:cbb3-type cytochrome c oxidase subunit 3 [Tateyamaria sp. SN3-11]|uniref:cbb3-type cytochrome c oxidase subunit 3 n=1 Tax=Tateyamaria sp. SN3-11 TaxID=3092147 RepID=UPI0039E96A5C